MRVLLTPAWCTIRAFITDGYVRAGHAGVDESVLRLRNIELPFQCNGNRFEGGGVGTAVGNRSTSPLLILALASATSLCWKSLTPASGAAVLSTFTLDGILTDLRRYLLFDEEAEEF